METEIRNATLSDIPALLDFARHVGRFVSADEVRTWLQVDSEAMFVAKASSDGKLIGSCCGTRLSAELGFMGLYVVLDEYRGKGIGYKLWKAAKEHIGDRNIGVRGDPINFQKYTEKEGFCHVEDYSIIYYECFGDSVPTNITASFDIEVATYFEGNLIGSSKIFSNDSSSIDEKVAHKGSKTGESDAGNFESKTTCIEGCITPNVESSEKTAHTALQLNGRKSSAAEYVGESVPSNGTAEDMSTQMINPKDINNSKAEDILSGVVSFDKLLHKRDRSLIVRQTFSWSSCLSKVALVGGKVAGYACLRNVVTEHWIISPFYADTEDIAERLLFELLQGFNFSQAPKGIQIRFPDKNIAGKRLAEKFGFREKAIRILTGFTKRCVNIDTSKVYSFHSTVFCSE